MRLPRIGPDLLRRLAIASLVANIGIICTGGAVRLTGSGLGCPTWPRCTVESWTPRGALDIHGAIEFGNRMLAIVLAVVAIVTWIVAMRARPRRPGVRLPATLLALGVPTQAVVGGLTVRTDLDPAWVAPHFMLSMVLVSLAVVLVRRTGEPPGPVTRVVPPPLRALAWITYGTTILVLYLGTLVTGSGPHAGDDTAARTGLDPEAISRLHTDAVCLLLGLTLGLLLGLRGVGPAVPVRTGRAVVLLLAAELGQGLIGVVQYVTGLPIVLVGLHMLGAALIMAAVTAVVLGTRERAPVATGTVPGRTGAILPGEAREPEAAAARSQPDSARSD